MTRRAVCLFVLVLALACGSHAREASAQVCLPTFGYGNVGYASGYSIQQVGGWCGPRRGWCGPRWGGWCGPRFGYGRWGWGGAGGGNAGWGGWCGPRWGWGCRPWGWRQACYAPAYSYGCSYGWPVSYGTSWYPACDSIFMSSPGGGSFFSGAAIPFPTVGFPGFAPGFVSTRPVSAQVANVAAAPASFPQVGQVVTTIRDLRGRRGLAQQGVTRSVAVRPANAVTRLRAARLIAQGDRHLRTANGDPAHVRRAVDSYRRAAGIAGDQPDTFVREAVALVALGEHGQADAALARAVAIDGRLAGTRSSDDGERAADPVFGDRPVGAASPVAARGVAVLRQIGMPAAGGEADPAIAWLAGRWSERFDAAPPHAAPARIALK